MQYTSPLDVYRDMKRVLDASDRSARQEWRKVPEGTFRDMKEYTSGGISSRTLTLMGHPYARAGAGVRGVSKSFGGRIGKVPAPLLPINRQSSALYRSITLYHRSNRFSVDDSVGFDAGKAGRSINAVAPQGTRYVVPRGIWTALDKRARARMRAHNDRYLRNQIASFSQP